LACKDVRSFEKLKLTHNKRAIRDVLHGTYLGIHRELHPPRRDARRLQNLETGWRGATCAVNAHYETFQHVLH
jgi:hypothetical protein